MPDLINAVNRILRWFAYGNLVISASKSTKSVDSLKVMAEFELLANKLSEVHSFVGAMIDACIHLMTFMCNSML